MSEQAKSFLKPIGLSDDGRTNRWRVHPGCGHKPFEPITTMYRHQYVQCPRCGLEYLLNFDAQTAESFAK